MRGMYSNYVVQKLFSELRRQTRAMPQACLNLMHCERVNTELSNY